MADVRLTATNPADSSVVPVACNEKGELKLEEIPDQSFDGNLQGDLTVSGTAVFGNGTYSITGSVTSSTPSPGSYGRHTINAPDSNASYMLHVENGSSYSLFNSPTGKNEIKLWCQGSEKYSYISVGEGDKAIIYADGSAEFKSDVVIGSRGSQWMIVESGGLAHLIQQTSFKGQPRNNDGYPQLRNIPNELTMVEQALADVMEKLRMIPPAGWEVWDGSSENS